MDMLDRMQTGRFKVFKHLNDWWEEFRLYHRKDGKVVKEGDDLMAATRYALMMLRYARTEKERRNFHRDIEYPSMMSKPFETVFVTMRPPRFGDHVGVVEEGHFKTVDDV